MCLQKESQKLSITHEPDADPFECNNILHVAWYKES